MSPVISVGRVVGDCVANQVSDTPANVSEWTLFAGSAATNIASTIVRLGESAVLVACVGDDRVGQQLLHDIRELGIDVSLMKVVDGGKTLQVKILRNSSGTSTILKPDLPPSSYADVHLSIDMIEAIPGRYFEPPGALILQSTQLAFESGRGALHRAADRAAAAGLPVMLDVNWRKSYWNPTDDAVAEISRLAARVQYLKLTQAEANWLCGTGSTLDDVQGRFPQLRGLMITNGDQGTTYLIQGTSGQVAPFPIKPVESTGAGDAFVAGFVSRICRHGDAALADPAIAHDAVRFASACGAIAASKLGATNVIASLSEVEAIMLGG